jgi:hypothetical protein
VTTSNLRCSKVPKTNPVLSTPNKEFEDSRFHHHNGKIIKENVTVVHLHFQMLERFHFLKPVLL